MTTLDAVLEQLATDEEQAAAAQAAAMQKALLAFKETALAAAKGRPPTKEHIRKMLADAEKTPDDLRDEVNRLLRRQSLIAERQALLPLPAKIDALGREIAEHAAKHAQVVAAFETEQARLAAQRDALQQSFAAVAGIETELRQVADASLLAEIEQLRFRLPSAAIAILSDELKRLGEEDYTLAQYEADAAKLKQFQRTEAELVAKLAELEKKLLTAMEG